MMLIHLTYLFIFALFLSLFPICNVNTLLTGSLPVSFPTESSVWCTKGHNEVNLCKFKNVCYRLPEKTIVFFLNENSVIKGFSNYSDFQKIQLSSIDSHNQFYVNITMIDSSHVMDVKADSVESKAFLLSRFKPNNIMHVIHDDLFPLFLSLEYFCMGDMNCITSYTLVFHDNLKSGPYFSLYELFSKNDPVILNMLGSAHGYVYCMKEMLTGLVQDGIFYQYGFKKPHGSVHNPLLNKYDISRFTTFIRDKLKLNDKKRNRADIVLIKRQKSRRILNFEDVTVMAREVYQNVYRKQSISILTLDFIANSTDDFISVLSNCDMVLGMHGAEMIFTIFTKPKTLIVELFPFGIAPDIVSFVKPIAHLDGGHLIYFSWSNKYKNNSVGHPLAHPMFGGINHLSRDEQEEIQNTQLVPAVKCCNEPNYLYHMYQDTWVGNDLKKSLETFILNLLKHRADYKNNIHTGGKWFHPYIPSNVSCEFDKNTKELVIKWQTPFNVEETSDLEYSIYVSDEGDAFKREFVTKLTFVRVQIGNHVGNGKFVFWISVRYLKNDSRSRDAFFTC